MKYLFVSDLHLGSPISKADHILNRLLAYEDYDKVFIVGDFLDVWEKSLSKLKIEFAGLIEELNLLGEKLVIVTGNHDPKDSELIELFPQAFVTTEYVKHIGDFSICIVHGDAFDENISLANKFFWLHWLFERVGINFKGIIRSLLYEDNKSIIVSSVEAAAIKSSKNDFNCLIMGHTHLPKIVNYNDFIYVNIGSLIYSPTYVELENNILRLIGVEDGLVYNKISIH